ncbi:MAG: sensor histidine kinase, partial [Mycobacterium sp.]|nr:sensor histidine kinase [Mycobacterium sp.]
RLMAVRGRRVRPIVLDLGTAGVLCLLDLAVSFDVTDSRAVSTTTTVAYAAVGYLALAGRRRWPGPVFAVVLVHSLLGPLVVPGYLPTIGLWLALYTVAVHGTRRWAAVGLCCMAPHAALNVIDEMQRHRGSDEASAVISSIVLSIGIAVAIAGAGRWARWSVHQRLVVAEHAAAEAVSCERSRIARDMHDVVAHSVTLMILQAGGAARLLRSEPDRAQVALGHVDDLGQQAIFELRRLLGLLAPERTDSSSGRTAPSGLRDLAQLVNEVRAAGVRVELAVSGEPADLEPGVDVSACRIAQEALTNAARYADPRRPVEVGVHWHSGGVQIRVLNHIRRAPARSLSGGHGILGIRERVRISGGRIDAGPQPDGRFLVDVHLPLAPRRLADTGPRRP